MSEDLLSMIVEYFNPMLWRLTKSKNVDPATTAGSRGTLQWTVEDVSESKVAKGNGRQAKELAKDPGFGFLAKEQILVAMAREVSAWEKALVAALVKVVVM